ncbi:Ger(x)C family spore germination protein [Marasmitruncus massiliensis]|uniref:Ger(x)C family spore germination protein n=1 Tax=Marasmitruncus massiliensis TaxID=1944642 RepID=UPI000C796F71|nr:Ger(x)C family spore germination protein [Marasmitruncus massiliensis]
MKKAMIKRIVCCAFCLSALFLLNGCWDYRGLNEITLVSGVAVDKDPLTGRYLVSCEIIDLTQSLQEKGPTGKVIESEGSTIFEAVRNAKRRLVNKLYFGNAQVLVLSEQVVKEEDLGDVIDWFLRDAECRETVHVVISQEKKASDLFRVSGTDQTVAAFELNSIVTKDPEFTSTTSPLELYKVFDKIVNPGISPTLPAFHITENDEKEIDELNGIAIFKNERLQGYLSPEDSKYFLFITNGVKGGILPISSNDDGSNDVSLEIFENKTKPSFSYKDGKLKIKLKVQTTVDVAEAETKIASSDDQTIKKLEKTGSEQLKRRMEAVIKKVQKQYNSDIFGFGKLIYKKNPKLWETLSPDWDTLFPNLEVEITPEIRIINTALKK